MSTSTWSVPCWMSRIGAEPPCQSQIGEVSDVNWSVMAHTAFVARARQSPSRSLGVPGTAMYSGVTS